MKIFHISAMWFALQLASYLLYKCTFGSYTRKSGVIDLLLSFTEETQ